MSDEEKKSEEDRPEGPKMVTWAKEDGTKVKINDLPANIAAAEKLGWKRKGK